VAQPLGCRVETRLDPCLPVSRRRIENKGLVQGRILCFRGVPAPPVPVTHLFRDRPLAAAQKKSVRSRPRPGLSPERFSWLPHHPSLVLARGVVFRLQLVERGGRQIDADELRNLGPEKRSWAWRGKIDTGVRQRTLAPFFGLLLFSIRHRPTAISAGARQPE